MKIGIGLPNQVRNVDPAVIPAWAAQAEQAGFSTLGTVGRIAYPGVMDTVAIGIREDDFVADGHGVRGRGKRFDHDLETYREVWRGANVGGDLNPAVPQ